MSGPVGSIGVAVVPDATNFWREFEAKTLGEADRAGHKAGEALMRGVDSATAKGTDIQVHLDTARALLQIEKLKAEMEAIGREQIKLDTQGGRGFESRWSRIAKVLALVGPALVPIAAVGVAGLAALVPASGAAIAGIKGLTEEYKSGALAGTELGKNIKYMSTQWAGLQKISAAPLGVGINEAIKGIKSQMPAVNAQFRTFSGVLGAVTANVAPGLVHLFTTNLVPMFTTMNSALIGGSQAFGKWAMSSGALKGFVAYVNANLPQTLQALGSIGEGLVHIFAAIAPYGHAVLGLIAGIAHGIAGIPIGVLKPFASGLLAVFAAFRTMRGVESIFDGMAKNWARVQTASGRFASVLRTDVGTVVASQESAAAATTASAATQAAANDAAAASSTSAARTISVNSAGVAEVKGTEAEAVAVANASIGESATAAAGADEAAARVFVVDSDGIATSRQAAAAEITAANAVIAEDSVATSEAVVASGTAARAGWIGLAGPIAGIVIGIGVIASMFHRSAAASKEATDAAKSYTDVLASGGGKQDIFGAVVKELSNNDVPGKIADLNKQLGTTAFTGSQFAKAITSGGAPLAALRKQLLAVRAASQKVNAGGFTTGVNTKQYTAANDLLKDLNAQYGALSKTAKKELTDTKAFAGAASNIKQVAGAMGLSTDAATQYAQMLGITATKQGTTAVSAASLHNALTDVSAAYNNADQTGSAYLDALAKFSQSSGTAADRAALIGSTLKAANGDALNFAGQINNAAQAGKALGDDMAKGAKDAKKSIGAYAKSIVNLKTGTIDYKNAAAGPLINDLTQLQTAAMNAAQATYQHNKAVEGGKKAADDAYDVYQNYTSKWLTDNHKKLGLSADAAGKLAKQYFGMPKDVKTKIEAIGTNPMLTALNQIGTLLARIAHTKWRPVIDANTNPAAAKIASIQAKMAAVKPKTVTVNAETGQAQVELSRLQYQLASLQDKSIYVTTYTQTKAINTGTKAAPRGNVGLNRAGIAEGGYITGPGTGTSDDIPAWLSNGEFVMTARATAAHRAQLEAWNNGYAKGGMVGYAAGGEIDTIRTTTHTGKGKTRKTHIDIDYRYNGHIYSTANAVINAYNSFVKSLHNTAVRLRLTVDTKDIAKVNKAIKGSASDVHDAFSQVYTDLKNMGASASYLHRFYLGEQKVIKATQLRAKTVAQLATATSHLTDVQKTYNDQISSARSATLSNFDITSAGKGPSGDKSPTFATIAAQQAQATNQASAFQKAISGLIGKGLSKSYVQQLANSGPQALAQAQALNSASKAQIAGINAQYSKQYASGTTEGSQVASYIYGRQLDTAKALVYGRSNKDRATDADVAALAKALYGKNAPAQKYLNEGLRKYASDNQKSINHLATTMETSMKRAAKTLADRPVKLIANGRELARVVDEGHRQNARR